MKFALTFIVACAFAVQAQAITILSTDFDGRTVAGATASNLTYVTDGVADPGNLTVSEPAPVAPPLALFDTTDAQNRFAPNRNIHNEGAWSVDVPLSVLGATLGLTTVSLDAFIFNNSGVLQADQRDVDFTLELLDAGLTVLDSDTVLDVYANTGTATQPQNISFDLSGNTLAANTDFFLRLTSVGQGPGNNSGIDNLVVEGFVVVPEPATATLGLFGLAALAARRRRAA